MAATHVRAPSEVRCRIVLPKSSAQVNYCSVPGRLIWLPKLNPDAISSIVTPHLPHSIEAIFSSPVDLKSLFNPLNRTQQA